MTGDIQSIFSVESLSKRYAGFSALKEVSFVVKSGEVFVLLGPNGSGKSTCLKLMCGLIRPTKGRALFLGKEVRDMPTEFRARMSFLPQRIRFPENLTAGEVLSFYGRLRLIGQSRIDEISILVGLHQDEALGKFCGELSGGTNQRLALCVACLPDVDVYLMDEPTASLDPEGVLLLRSLVKRLKEQGKTVVLSTHLLDDALELADRVAVLVGGELRVILSREEFVQRIEARAVLRVDALNIPESALEQLGKSGVKLLKVHEGVSHLACEPKNRADILNALLRSGATLRNFQIEKPSLEEIYLELTGKTLAEDLETNGVCASTLIDFPSGKGSEGKTGKSAKASCGNPARKEGGWAEH